MAGRLSGQDIVEKCIYKYRVENGLSGNNIRSIYQDSLGFVWISTQDGLNRFDGKNFDQYGASSDLKRRITGMDVRAVVADRDQGLLWALTNVQGLHAIDPLSGNIVKYVPSSNNSYNDWDITMAYGAKRLWVGSNNGIKVYNVPQSKWEQSPFLPFSPNKKGDLLAVRTLLVDKYQRVWLFVNHYGVVLLDGRENRVLDFVPQEKLGLSAPNAELSFSSALEWGTDTLMVGTSEGLRGLSVSGNRIRVLPHFPHVDNLNKARICALVKTSQYLYVGTEQGLYQCERTLSNATKVHEFSKHGEEWFGSIQCLYTDREDNVWIGCKEGLAYLRTQSNPFERINQQEHPEAKINQVYCVKPFGQDLIVGMQKGLVRYVPSQKRFYFLEENKAYNYAFFDQDSHLVVSANDGLFILKKDSLQPLQRVHPETAPFASSFINSAVLLRDSVWAIGSDNARGVFLWNYKRRSVQNLHHASKNPRLRSNIVNKVYKDRKGRLWILSDLGVDLLSQNRKSIRYLILEDKKRKISPKLFFDICETESNVWISAYGYGLLQLDKEGTLLNIYDQEQGLSVNGVYALFNHNDEKILVSTNNGLSVFDLHTHSFYNYYEPDGLHSNAFEENCGNPYQDRFVLGGLHGFTVVDPKLLKINRKAPTVYISRIRLESNANVIDTSNLLLQHLDVPADVIRATLHFSVLHFSNPLRIKVMYKIAEISNNWIPVEGQEAISLMGMSPGTYTVQILSSNEHGIWNQVPTTVTLRFLPKWYQTLWFQLAMVTTCMMVVYLLYRYRLQQLKEQQEIRKSIASDLHDDLGSSLNTVKIFTHLAKKEKDNIQYLNEIEATLTMASASMRDMLWVLDDTKDSCKELLERIQRFAAPILAAQSIHLVLDCEKDCENEMLTKGEKRNVLLIAKEAINNSLKYSNCKTITVKISKASSKKTFMVSDDGIGFDLSKSSEGHGRKNMLYRAKQIHYWLTVTSSPQQGTSVSLRQL